jgi:hypothetical protein
MMRIPTSHSIARWLRAPLACLALAAFLLSAPCSHATCLLHILVTIAHNHCDHRDHNAPCDAEDCGACVEHAHQAAQVPAHPAAPPPPPACATHDRPANDGQPDSVCVPVFVPPKVAA